MSDTPNSLTPQQISFREAYVAERQKQELQGAVCVSPEEIYARMSNLSVEEFEVLLEQMRKQFLIGVGNTSIPNQRVVIWYE